MIRRPNNTSVSPIVTIGAAASQESGKTNLSNRGLPSVASNQTGTDTALYDLIGRSSYIGIKVKF